MGDRGLWKLQLRQMTPGSGSGGVSTTELSPRRWKDEMKRQRERLQVYLIAEEKKALRIIQLQRERENQELRELRLQQLELARLHSQTRVMYFYGWKPWLDSLACGRSFAESAMFHSALCLTGKSLRAWKLLVSSERRDRNACKKQLRLRADYFRSRWLQRNSWRAWVMLQRAVSAYSWALLRSCLSSWKKYWSAGVAANVAGLLKQTWCTWLHSLEEIKSVKLLDGLKKERLADGHARRMLRRNVLQGWLQEASRGRQEADRIKRHAEAWVKIHSWLEELEQVVTSYCLCSVVFRTLALVRNSPTQPFDGDGLSVFRPFVRCGGWVENTQGLRHKFFRRP